MAPTSQALYEVKLHNLAGTISRWAQSAGVDPGIADSASEHPIRLGVMSCLPLLEPLQMRFLQLRLLGRGSGSS